MITMTDLFCGGGGSSTGAVQIPGVQVRMAANHARKAVNTHQANHPDADHDCADISQVVPGRYPATDILWASPECTNHSRAKGRRRGHGEYNDGLFAADGTDEAAIRSRATMWDVPRFAEAHRYPIIIVENVPDARWWGPDDMPGGTFDAWLAVMRSWGYEHRIIYLDSAHAQAYGPGSRSRRPRMYVKFWRKGHRAPDFEKWLRPYGDCPMHGRVQLIQAWKHTKMSSPDRPWGVYGKTGQYLYRCPRVECRNAVVEPAVRSAADAIDWTLPAQIIGDRSRPLKANTMRRIRDGFAKFSRPLLVPTEGREGKTADPADRLLRTVTTRNETGLAVPPYMVELRGGGSSHRSAAAPMSTVTAGGNHHGLVTAPDLLVPYYSNGKAQLAAEPMATVTTVERHSLLVGGRVAAVEDCRFRMIEPHEYARAMEFPDDYVFIGETAGKPPTKRQWVEMVGNAVTPNVARDLVAMAVEALTGEAIEPARA
ncbi:DNA cytosine methyltransferase [Kitasatospora sp. NPDC054939]